MNYRQDITKEILDKYYIEQKLSAITISKILKCSPTTINKKLRLLGFNVRSYSESNRIYSLKEDFFETWNNDVAYIIGFILADGCVNKRRGNYTTSLSIHKKDIEVLKFILEKIESNQTIKVYKNYRSIHLHSLKIGQKLISLGITPRKSGKEIIPYGLPDCYFPDFLRGVFDGDGCVSLGKIWQINICSSSFDFLNSLRNKIGFGTIHITEKGRYNNPNYDVVQYRPKNTHEKLKFVELIYNNNFCLSRKFNKTKQALTFLRNKILIKNNKKNKIYLNQTNMLLDKFNSYEVYRCA